MTNRIGVQVTNHRMATIRPSDWGIALYFIMFRPSGQKAISADQIRDIGDVRSNKMRINQKRRGEFKKSYVADWRYEIGGRSGPLRRPARTRPKTNQRSLRSHQRPYLVASVGAQFKIINNLRNRSPPNYAYRDSGTPKSGLNC
jgi:hypothetical protein